jgi:four helix bundle protein
MATFQALQVAHELVGALRSILPTIRLHDPDLASQLRRAATSVTLNLAEGAQRIGRDRLHLYRIASGSAAEVHAALDIALAWGYAPRACLAPAQALAGRVVAMLWRLTHPRPIDSAA